MADISRQYERMPALGVFPPEPSRNEKTNNFDWSVYVPSVNVREIPIGLQFGGGVYIRREPSFQSSASGQLEAPFIVSGPNSNAVRTRAQAVFSIS
jgi:hypothetical protein